MGNNIRFQPPESPCPLDSYAAAGGRDGQSIFCLLAGVEALAEMMEEDCAGPDIAAMGTVEVIAGAGHIARSATTAAKWVARPRVRDRAGKEVSRVGRRYAMATCCLGAQPDGAERVDPQVPPRGPSEGDLAKVATIEVGRFPALCGAVTQEDEGLSPRISRNSS